MAEAFTGPAGALLRRASDLLADSKMGLTRDVDSIDHEERSAMRVLQEEVARYEAELLRK